MPPWRSHLSSGWIEDHYHHSTRCSSHRGKTCSIPIHSQLRIEAVQPGQCPPLRLCHRPLGMYGPPPFCKLEINFAVAKKLTISLLLIVKSFLCLKRTTFE